MKHLVSWAGLSIALSVLQLGCGWDFRDHDHGDYWRGGRAYRPPPAPRSETGDEADGGGAGCVPSDPCEMGMALPDDQHFAAAGLCVRAVALKQGKLRQLAFAPNGDLFGILQSGEIRRYRDVDCDGSFSDSEQVAWANTGGSNGNSVHVDAAGAFLYAGTPQGVARFRIRASAEQAESQQTVVIGQPTNGRHPYGTLHLFGKWLYVQSGAADNVILTSTGEYDNDRSVLKRFDLNLFDARIPFEWQHGQVFANGLRNAVGFTHDAEGAVWGVVNGIDDLYYQGRDVHATNPGEMVAQLARGSGWGFPFCFAALDLTTQDGERVPVGSQRATELAPSESFKNPHDDAWCADHAAEPQSLLNPHSAPLDILYVDRNASALPEHYSRGAFITLHGSSDTEPSTGHRVVWLAWGDGGRPELPAIEADGSVRYPYEVVFGGGRAGQPQDGSWGWQGEDVVRPVGVAVSPVDGALYVSSDNGKLQSSGDTSSEDGALYRIARQN